MPGFFAKNTHPDYLCRQNHLGRILMDIRKTLLNNPINNRQTPPPAVCLESATSGDEMEHSDSLSTAVGLVMSNQTDEKDSNIPRQSTSATDQNNVCLSCHMTLRYLLVLVSNSMIRNNRIPVMHKQRRWCPLKHLKRLLHSCPSLS